MRGSSSSAASTHGLEGVARTALSPLYARAYARGILPGVGFSDPWAECLLLRTGGHRAPEVLRGRFHTTTSLLRSLSFDALVTEFTRRHPHATVISVGVGLCTRNHRLANSTPASVSWVGVDTPDVIELRQRLLPDESMTLVAESLDSPAWSRGVPQVAGPALVLAEGVLMYLHRDGLRRFLDATREAFGYGTELAADYYHPVIARGDRHPVVRATGVGFRSAVRDGGQLAALGEGWVCQGEHSVLERVGPSTRLAALVFRGLTLGGRPHAVARLRVVSAPRG